MPTTPRGIDYPASTDAPRVWEDMQAMADSTDTAIGVVAAAVSDGLAKYKKKTANQSVTSSTTMQDDSELVVTLAAGKVYQIDFFPAVTGSAAGDVKFAWVMTGGVAQLTTRSCIGPGAGATDVGSATVVRMSRHNVTTQVAYATDDAQTSAIRETFLVETTTSGASGTLQLQWAQVAASATATTLSPSSFLMVTTVTPA